MISMTHFNSKKCILLYTLHYTLHTLHYITLHYITLHYITLHYITLQHLSDQGTFTPVGAQRGVPWNPP